MAANTLICLIHQANYLLDRQLRQLEQQFLKEGGFTEKLYRARQAGEEAAMIFEFKALGRCDRRPGGVRFQRI